ncbi:DUF6777 domain-containing protein [Streptomyces sp. NPDC088729]|uniref:DUF6777 domain-containing protein n=1 Tax=Streptomyces sp. NPDC088729 TaxID=3365876 RepID=UPI00380433D0
MRSPRRSPRRFRRAALAVLSAGVLLAAAGCGGGADRTTKGTTGTAETKDVLLQPIASPGPGPFTASTVRRSAAPFPSGEPGAGGSSATRTVHPVPGDAPGLYGGVRSQAACDVGRQTRLLTDDRDRADAFAEAAGIERVQIPGYLRSLTPVVLRADAQVTGHGYSGGSAAAFQAVLQAGTAVLVDSRGLPRVRCACGNPLKPPALAQGRVTYRGERWSGYDPSRTVEVEPSKRVLTTLLVGDLSDGSWIERTAGDGGGRDRTPGDPPPYAPDEAPLLPSPPAPPDSPPSEADPSEPSPPGEAYPSDPDECPTPAPGDPVEPPPGCPPVPDPDPDTGAPDGFDEEPPQEPWELEEGEPVPEPTQVLPDEPAAPDGYDVPEPFAG